MLIEVHIIQNHAPSNLNRDESGSPKSAIFSGYRRARISSQCLKRCYRTSKTFRDELDKETKLGMHTTSMPEEVVRRAGLTLSDEESRQIAVWLAGVIKKSDGGSTGVEADGEGTSQTAQVDKASAQSDKLKTAQSVFWRETELQAMAQGLQEWAKNGKKDKKFDATTALKQAGLDWAGIPVDMALFGRMVTSDLMHNVEGSTQFAHAISTHEFAREYDLWTRVDDRRDKRLDFYRAAFGAEKKLDSGTDGMGDAEFTSACYYMYFNVDFDALVANLTGKALKHDLKVPQTDEDNAKKTACAAVVGLVKAAILERPTGKFNSMATPSLPTLVLIEVRSSHVPVSYADAFAKPVDPRNEEKQSDTGQIERVDLPKESARRMIRQVNQITKAFNRKAMVRLLFTAGADIGASLQGQKTEPNTESVLEGKQDSIDKGPYTAVNDVCELVKALRSALD
jgi:CRISPR system Cascade subunit CasC